MRFRSGSLATQRPATYSNARSAARREYACVLWDRLSGFHIVDRRPCDHSSPDDDAHQVELQRTWPRERSRFLLTGASSWLTPSPKDRRDRGEHVSSFVTPYFAFYPQRAVLGTVPSNRKTGPSWLSTEGNLRGISPIGWSSAPEGGDDRHYDRPMPGDAGVALLLFDGDCGFCTTVASWAQKGFRHGERAEAWQVLGIQALDRLGLTVLDVEQAAWWVDVDGGLARGHRAVGRALQASRGWRRAAGDLVLTPPTSWAAAGVYRLVARWRSRLPGGTPACRPQQ